MIPPFLPINCGQTLNNVVLYGPGDLMVSEQPGDKLPVTGMYRALPHRSNPKICNLLSAHKNPINMMNFHKIDSTTCTPATLPP